MKENIFNEIDNDNIAYWLGFLAADGSLHSNRNQLEIGLSSKDREHLIKFQQFLEADNIITNRQTLCSNNGKYYSSSYINIYNSQIFNDLSKYNIVPNKSHLNIDFLAFIPEQYKIPFILGIFDGDGWFTCSEKSQGFGFCGNQKIVTSVHQYLHNYFSYWKSMEGIHQYKNSLITYNFNITTKTQLLDFCKLYLSYSNKCDLLERKKEIAKNLIQILDKKIQLKELKLINLSKKYKSKERYYSAIEQICPICGKKFLSPHHSPYKYCSQECVHKAQYRCEHPDKETLQQLLIDNKGNFCAVARKFGVTDNAVRKWCKKYKLPFHSSDYK